jgi:hypothetical protein
MGMRAALQEFFGEKFFRDKVTFDKDVVFKRTVTAYSPVASEPSLGTEHMFASQQTLYDADPAATSGTITVSNAPVGTTKVKGWWLMSGTAVNTDAYIRGVGSTGTRVFAWLRTKVGGVWEYGTFEVPIDSSKQFNWAISSAADVNLLRIYGDFYSC